MHCLAEIRCSQSGPRTLREGRDGCDIPCLVIISQGVPVGVGDQKKLYTLAAPRCRPLAVFTLS